MAQDVIRKKMTEQTDERDCFNMAESETVPSCGIVDAGTIENAGLNHLISFADDRHEIILGDALIALDELIQDESIDLVFADPPYNIGKVFNGKKESWETDADTWNGVIIGSTFVCAN